MGLRYKSGFIVQVRFDNCSDGAVVVVKWPATRRVRGESDVVVLGQFESVAESSYLDTDQAVDDDHNADNDPIIKQWLE